MLADDLPQELHATSDELDQKTINHISVGCETHLELISFPSVLSGSAPVQPSEKDKGRVVSHGLFLGVFLVSLCILVTLTKSIARTSSSLYINTFGGGPY